MNKKLSVIHVILSVTVMKSKTVLIELVAAFCPCFLVFAGKWVSTFIDLTVYDLCLICTKD